MNLPRCPLHPRVGVALRPCESKTAHGEHHYMHRVGTGQKPHCCWCSGKVPATTVVEWGYRMPTTDPAGHGDEDPILATKDAALWHKEHDCASVFRRTATTTEWVEHP